MTPTDLALLGTLAEESAAAAEQFHAEHEAALEDYRQHLTVGIKAANERLRLDVAEIAGEHPLCVALAGQVTEYVDWLQWSLWDLPYFAVTIQPDPDRFRIRAASCAQVYLAGRVFDDVIDHHFWYKARRPTMLSMTAEHQPRGERVEGLAILSGLLLLSDGLLNLADPRDEEHTALLRKLLQSLRRVVVGAILEHAERKDWSPAYYERLVQLKNVDFWRILYSAVDTERASPLYPFLERYYALAQKLNDVQDFAEDERRGQPNLVSIHLPNPQTQTIAGGFPLAVEQHLAEGFLDLRRRALTLDQPERGVALLKLGESLNEAHRLGLFGGLNTADSGSAATPSDPGDADEPAAAPLGLHWHSTLADVVDTSGANALVAVPCPVCATDDARRLFERQGFTIHRCRECSHVYVNPRVDLALQLRMARELEEVDEENEFLEVQRIFAEPICHLLRLRTAGSRLLDLGFGRGYILKLARAYGFEVYGLDISNYLAERLRPEFGERLHTGALGDDPIPWDDFDVVVMSHVVEHLADPGAVLREVWAKLRPNGILFVAVPDIASLQFKMFGKHWDVVNPLVHFQYFNEASMTRLLTDCGFSDIERIAYPALPRELTPKWMRLMRKLGGDESGELAMIAKRPAIERLLASIPAGDDPPHRQQRGPAP